MKVIDFLQNLWYSETEANVFLVIYQYGPKPASSIASLAKIDRTYCYKVIQNFVQDGLVHTSLQKWIKYFWIPNPDVLQISINKKRQSVLALDEQFKEIRQELITLDSKKSWFVPQIKIFEWKEVVARFYDDILQTIKDRNLIVISFFVSNIFVSQASKLFEFSELYREFIQNLEKNRIQIEWYIGEWILVMESVNKVLNYEDIQKIIPWQDAIYSYIVGDSLYILQFRETVVGLKIQSVGMADMFNFMLGRL